MVSYQILSRKYRPQRFDELFGQEHVVQLLGNAVRTDRVAQAWLFVGPRGVGKTTTARILARSLNCSSRVDDIEPCGTCPSCTDIAAGSDMDVVEMDAASNNHVDDVRALREQVGYATVRSRYRIWIVDEVHMLSAAAFNAFLKTLEEPPPDVKFFFCTTEAHKLPETIRSRCIRVELRPIRPEAIVARLQWLVAQEGLAVEPELPAAIAASAHGGLRDAESLLEQLVAACPDATLRVADLDHLCGRAASVHVDALWAAIAGRDPAAALSAVDASLGSGAKPGVLLDQWLDRFRQDLVQGARQSPPSVAAAANAIDLLLEKRAHVRAGADGDLVAQVAAVELASLPSARDLDRLLHARARETQARETPAHESGGSPSSPVVEAGDEPAPRIAAPPTRAPQGPGPGSAGSKRPGSNRAESRTAAQGLTRLQAVWPDLVQDVRTRDTALADLLERADVSDLRGDRAVLTVPGHAHAARTLLVRGEMQLLFGQASRRVYGSLLRPVVDVLSPTDDAPAPVDLTLRDHPVVQRVTEMTGGRLVSVRTRSHTDTKRTSS